MIKVIYMNDTSCAVESDIQNIPKIVEQKPKILWVDIAVDDQELSNEAITLLAETFKFHELSIEDCLFPQYQPKIEEFENYLFVAVHGIKTNERDYTDIEEKIFELDIFVSKDYIITVHNDQIPLLDLLFEKAKLRPQVLLKSHEYILYTIVDKVYSTFEFIMDKMNTKINDVEDKLLDNHSDELTKEIFSVKKSIVALRKIVEPQQSVYSYFTREGNGIITKKYAAYFRDLLSDYKRISQTLETYNQMISSILEVYVSSVTLKLNEVMKFLTVIATIFLPALLITSYYGMNVQPFMEHRILGEGNVWYFAFTMIVLSTVGIFIYLKKKKWL